MVRKMTKEQNYDVVIAGCGVAGLYTVTICSFPLEAFFFS